jgi:hypothetical protein
MILTSGIMRCTDFLAQRVVTGVVGFLETQQMVNVARKSRTLPFQATAVRDGPGFPVACRSSGEFTH